MGRLIDGTTEKMMTKPEKSFTGSAMKGFVRSGSNLNPINGTDEMMNETRASGWRPRWMS